MRFQIFLTSALGVTLLPSTSQASTEPSLTGNVISDMVAEYMVTCALGTQSRDETQTSVGGMQFDHESCLSKELLKMMFSKRDKAPSRYLLENNGNFFDHDIPNADEQKFEDDYLNEKGGDGIHKEDDIPNADEQKFEDEIYDLAADFSATNPNGIWTYGKYNTAQDPTSFATFTDYSEHAFLASGQPNANIKSWSFLGQVDPNIAKNVGTSVASWPAAALTFNPGKVVFGPYLGPTVARFTAPVGGTYQVDASFAGTQTMHSPANAYIYDGSDYTDLGSTGTTVQYSNILQLVEGAYVDFVVGDQLKSTQVSATIKPVSYLNEKGGDGIHEEDECRPPLVDEGMVREFVGSVVTQCASNNDEVEQAVSLLTKIFSSKHCWESMCSEDFGMTMLSSWLKSCASIELPYPLAHPEQMAADPELYEMDVKLSCMLDFLMSSNYSTFGLQEPIPGSMESCYPPGHEDAANFCPSKIGPAALLHCKNVTLYGPPDHGFEDPFDDYDGMSYFFGKDFSLSYSFGSEDDFEADFSYKYDDSDDSENDQLYIDNLCDVVTKLSSEQGKICLVPLCEMDNDIREDNVPSTAPTGGNSDVLASLAPSTAPSMAPSTAPSLMPTVQKMTDPTLSPSMDPTMSPITQKATSLKITFEAEIELSNFDADDVPDPGPELIKFVEVLEKAITRLLPSDASAKVIRINGNPVSQQGRRLQLLGISIEFEVTMKLPCDQDDCSDAKEESGTLYNDVKEDLGESVSDGRLESNIQEEANTVDVRQLKSVSVKSDSFSASEAETSVEHSTEQDDGDENDTSDATGKSCASFQTSIVAVTAALLCHRSVTSG